MVLIIFNNQFYIIQYKASSSGFISIENFWKSTNFKIIIQKKKKKKLSHLSTSFIAPEVNVTGLRRVTSGSPQ